MRVDVINLGTGATRLGERTTRGTHGTGAARCWQGDVQRVGGRAVTNDLGERRCTAGKRTIESLQQQDARPFGHHESIATAVKWS